MSPDHAMQIYNDRAAKFRNTQSIQWRMNISIWTVLALASHYLTLNFLMALEISGVLLAIHGMYVYKVQWSLDCDKAVLDNIVGQLNNGEKNIIIDLKAKPGKFQPWDWIFIQMGVTLAISFALCTVTYLKEF